MYWFIVVLLIHCISHELLILLVTTRVQLIYCHEIYCEKYLGEYRENKVRTLGSFALREVTFKRIAQTCFLLIFKYWLGNWSQKNKFLSAYGLLAVFLNIGIKDFICLLTKVSNLGSIYGWSYSAFRAQNKSHATYISNILLWTVDFRKKVLKPFKDLWCVLFNISFSCILQIVFHHLSRNINNSNTKPMKYSCP